MENHQATEDVGAPSPKEPKRTWRKPEIRTLTIAFTKSGNVSGPHKGKEENPTDPSTSAYRPDS